MGLNFVTVDLRPNIVDTKVNTFHSIKTTTHTRRLFVYCGTGDQDIKRKQNLLKEQKTSKVKVSCTSCVGLS